MRILPFTSLAVLLLAACATPEPALPPPVAPPVNNTVMLPVPATERPLVQPSGHWLDWPATSGAWVYRQDERGSIALFGPPGGDALVTLRCDKNVRLLYLSRRGNSGSEMTIRTSSTSKTIAVQTTGGLPAYVAAFLQPNDPLLDAMAYSRGRIALEVPGMFNIAIPVWSEIGRVVEDCRA